MDDKKELTKKKTTTNQNKNDHPWKKPFSWNAKKQQNEIKQDMIKYGIE